MKTLEAPTPKADDKPRPGEYYVSNIEIKSEFKTYQLRLYFGPDGYRIVYVFPDSEAIGGFAHYDLSEMVKEVADYASHAISMLALDSRYLNQEAA